MILLMQMRDAEDADQWNDMQIPPNRNLPPVRGVIPLCQTADEVAERLVDANLDGIYRIVLDTGELWRITVTEQTRYVAETVLENPAV